MPVSTKLLGRPLSIGGRIMRNRIVCAPMSVGYAACDGHVTSRMIEHYARRAAGGAGMVITENLAVSSSGRQLPRQGLVCGEEHLPGLASLAEAIQRQGALAVLQIVHAGRYAGPWDEYESQRRLAPSAVAFELTPGRIVTPNEITYAEIVQVTQEFARATKLARRAGFDGIEVHGAQGMLISSFQSPRMNLRQDGYGTDRNRFAREVLAAVASEAGDMLLGYHLFCDELMSDGFTLSDAVSFARQIDGIGIHFIIPIPTTFESLRRRRAAEPEVDPTTHRPEVTTALAAAVNIPLFANGGLGVGDAAERAVASGDVSAVALARALFADPDWPRHRIAGRPTRRCGCAPPVCLQTQMTGAVCSAWPPEVSQKGYWGMHDIKLESYA